MSGTKPQLNVIWGLAVMLLIGMMGGVAATLWAVRTFNWQGAPAVNEQANRSRPTLEEGKPATGLPGVEPKAKAIMSATSKDGRFRFDLQGCRYQDMKIICTLEVTNLTGLDMPFSLNTDGASRAYTDKGLEFNANIAQLGSKQGWYAEQLLVANIPTPAGLQFRDIPQTSRLSLLKIGYRFLPPETARWEGDTIDFREVVLE